MHTTSPGLQPTREGASTSLNLGRRPDRPTLQPLGLTLTRVRLTANRMAFLLRTGQVFPLWFLGAGGGLPDPQAHGAPSGAPGGHLGTTSCSACLPLSLGAADTRRAGPALRACGPTPAASGPFSGSFCPTSQDRRPFWEGRADGQQGEVRRPGRGSGAAALVRGQRSMWGEAASGNKGPRPFLRVGGWGLQPAGPMARAPWRGALSASGRGRGRAGLRCLRGAEEASPGALRAGSQGRAGAIQRPSSPGRPQVPPRCSSGSLSHRSPTCWKGLPTHILLRSDLPCSSGS